ncbi:PIN domain-containing protein [Pseudomonas sp. GZD-209]|uniref:PIN domain-containing protein n=1 Tax=Pseudomonas sp. GZD-209 TaxID=3404807 RepID=UPI003BB58613
MTDHFIIDTNVLVQHPEVLAMTAENKLIIPKVVLDQLDLRQSRGVRGDIREVIKDAIKKGVHIAQSPSNLKEEPIVSDPRMQRLDNTDREIARVVKSYAERYGNAAVYLVTADQLLAKFLSLYGIKTITGAQFLEKSSATKADKDIQETAKKIISGQRRYLTLSFVLGTIAALAGTYIFDNFQLLISTISIWGTLIMLPILGVALYWYRENYRLSYGIFEFIVGIAMSYYAFLPNFDYLNITGVKVIQVLAGLYVMVRGLDNIGKSAEGTRLEQLWKRIF